MEQSLETPSEQHGVHPHLETPLPRGGADEDTPLPGGIAIAVVQGDRTGSTAFSSTASVDSLVPCTADTMFDIASSSKPLTAASIGSLVGDTTKPNVRRDAIMSALPQEDFQLSGQKATAEVTLDDVVGHKSGLPG